MKELTGHSSNIFLVPDADTQRLAASLEIVLIVSEPEYLVADGKLARVRQLSTLRFSATPGPLRAFIADLTRQVEEAERLAEVVKRGDWADSTS